ncbi:ATP-binding protein [Tuwongella immobilis]|nr:ATP-binding protein [Tuwongella immobilis]
MSVLSKIQTTAPALPSRIFLYAPEKWGKSSFAAYAPKPIFVMTEGETGLLSLVESGQVPETAHFPEDCRTWSQLQECVTALRREPHEFRSLVIDTANGAERLLSQHVLDTEYNGKMTGKTGYMSFGEGDRACVPHWVQFLQSLDDLRVKKKMMIILLSHVRTKTVSNPNGPDYDQVRPEGIERLWSLTHKWADIIGNGELDIRVQDEKVTHTGGRVLVTAGNAAVVAGNRYGLPDRIPCGKSAEAGWQNFASAVRAAKSRGQRQPIPEPAKRVDAEPQPQPAPTLPPPPPTPVLTPETAPPPPPTTVADLPTNTVGKLSTRAIELMHKLKLSWTEARQQYSPLIGMPEGEVYKLTDLTPSQLEHLIEMLEESQK